jgi:hypothetical protein
MNHTLLTANRSTHLRVVCVALSATIFLVGVFAFAHLSPSSGARENARTATTPAVDGVKGHFSAAFERTPL